MRRALDRVSHDLAHRPLLSCKIRVQSDTQTTVEYVKMLVDAGCQVIAVHGRTKEQKGHGLADWKLIRAIRGAVDVPLVANGNILVSAHSFRLESGCWQN